MKFFTMGYGGKDPKEFVKILQENKVKTVADVRLRPDRSSMGIYTKAKTGDKGIEALLAQADIEYRSFVELGNLFVDLPDWHERYSALVKRAGDLLTERLLREITEPFCLLCAEKLAENCHRGLISRHLVEKGHTLIAHLGQ
jgi:uncharacterized protein (DUF488 family)